MRERSFLRLFLEKVDIFFRKKPFRRKIYAFGKRKLRRYSGNPFLKTTMNFSLTICAFEIRVVGCFGLHSFMKINHLKVSQILNVYGLRLSFTSNCFRECNIYLSSMSFETNRHEHSNFHNFFWEVQNNPYTFLNLRHLCVNHLEGFTNGKKWATKICVDFAHRKYCILLPELF